jgi:hypothetical protein
MAKDAAVALLAGDVKALDDGGAERGDDLPGPESTVCGYLAAGAPMQKPHTKRDLRWRTRGPLGRPRAGPGGEDDHEPDHAEPHDLRRGGSCGVVFCVLFIQRGGEKSAKGAYLEVSASSKR